MEGETEARGMFYGCANEGAAEFYTRRKMVMEN